VIIFHWSVTPNMVSPFRLLIKKNEVIIIFSVDRKYSILSLNSYVSFNFRDVFVRIKFLKALCVEFLFFTLKSSFWIKKIRIPAG